jgi:hypothetical protein
LTKVGNGLHLQKEDGKKSYNNYNNYTLDSLFAVFKLCIYAVSTAVLQFCINATAPSIQILHLTVLSTHAYVLQFQHFKTHNFLDHSIFANTYLSFAVSAFKHPKFQTPNKNS